VVAFGLSRSAWESWASCFSRGSVLDDAAAAGGFFGAAGREEDLAACFLAGAAGVCARACCAAHAQSATEITPVRMWK
jgi:hypothetical protein